MRTGKVSDRRRNECTRLREAMESAFEALRDGADTLRSQDHRIGWLERRLEEAQEELAAVEERKKELEDEIARHEQINRPRRTEPRQAVKSPEASQIGGDQNNAQVPRGVGLSGLLWEREDWE